MYSNEWFAFFIDIISATNSNVHFLLPKLLQSYTRIDLQLRLPLFFFFSKCLLYQSSSWKIQLRDNVPKTEASTHPAVPNYVKKYSMAGINAK